MPLAEFELQNTEPAKTSRSFMEVPAILTSILLHLAVLIALALVTIPIAQRHATLTLLALPDPIEFDEPLVVENLQVRDMETDAVGSLGETRHLDGVSASANPTTITVAPSPPLHLVAGQPVLGKDPLLDPRGRDTSDDPMLRGYGGMALTAAEGAIDRITHEILLSLEQRPTTVVWLLDQSGSLNGQRDQIRHRLDRIYRELEQVQSRGFVDVPNGVDLLLSSVIAFGRDVTMRTKNPTADVAQLQQAIHAIEVDDSGKEMVFSAVQFAVQTHRRYRSGNAARPARNVMLVIFCDEVGDDQDLMDRCVQQCQQREIPVYVVGVPAPLGRDESIVKWVDPDPGYDQTPRWGRVNQGPESFQPELLRLRFVHDDRSLESLDSGFGPYALTRLCVETGGIYFTVHPNRQTDRPIADWETVPYSSYVRNFFSPEVMRRYRPDYVSASEYQRRLHGNQARAALVAAARTSALAPMENPQRRFIFRDEAQFAAELTEAQKAAARLAPKVDALYEILKKGESDRDREDAPRWQAGFDLAMGRVLAVKVRTDAYNAILAGAKGGLPLDNPKNNSWLLRTSPQLEPGSHLEALAEQATEYLQRVIREHPGTPWELLARKELEEPLGWQWQAYYTELNPPAEQFANNRPMVRDDQRRMLPSPAPSRPVPRL